MKKFTYILAALALIGLHTPAWAFGSSVVARQKVVNVQKVQKVEVKQVVQRVEVKQVVQVQQVQAIKVAQVVTPFVQVSAAYSYPVAAVAAYSSSCYTPAVYSAALVAPIYYGPTGEGTGGRLERLERSVEKLTDLQTQMLQRLQGAPAK